VAVRAVAWASGAPYHGWATHRRILESVSSSRRFVPDPNPALRDEALFEGRPEPRAHPYLGFELAEEARLVEVLVERAQLGRAAKRPLVLVLGGSVAQMFADEGAARLAARLAADPRWNAPEPWVVVLARGAYKQPQQLLFLCYVLALGVEPHAVVNLDGFNEVALSLQNVDQGFHPVFPSVFCWAPLAAGSLPVEVEAARQALLGAKRTLERRGERYLELGLARSAVAGRWALSRVRGDERRVAAAVDRYRQLLLQESAGRIAKGPRDARVEAAAVDECVRLWRDASLAMHQLCAARGITYLHVLQPTLHDPGAKPISDQERARCTIDPVWLKGVVQGYPKLREAGAALALDGIAFCDASRVFETVETTLYFDACHFRGPGYAILTDRIADFWLDRLGAR
ncbi:MAG TPA: hypothetical protein VJP77_05115, partial [Planctomycetota bacterium]|nr:hypothetical protein [Planctomycetota bacterium]